MTDLLTDLAARSRDRADAARPRLADLRARAADLPPPPPLALTPGGFDLIAEVKLIAPSAGTLAAPADPLAFVTAQAAAYARAGAAAISVLTEPHRFGGDLAHLAAVSAAVATPTMRKDFLVDPVQIWEARVAGASGVLLIVRMLGDHALRALLDAADAAGLWVLLECFDAADVARCRALPAAVTPRLIGVNSRDLRSLQVAPGRLETLGRHLPDDLPRVAESGLATAEDAADAARWGYTMALVGSALMRADDPTALARALREAGARARGEGASPPPPPTVGRSL
jgi:indole-3-glycerol phosphate synthase